MALQKEIWRQDIVDNLFKDNQFAERCVNADEFVLGGAVVHIPIAGTPAQVKKNITVFPQAAVERADSEALYAIDTYYSLPRRIANLDKYELSYDKRQSVVGEDMKNLTETAMNGLLWRWAPQAANVIPTNGDATAEDVLDGVTGQVLTFTKDAFKRIAKKWANRNFSGVQKTALLTANHYHQFIESLSEGEKTNVGRVADLAKGVVGQYMGVDILMRSTVLRYRFVAGVWIPVDETMEDFTPGTQDCAASLFYTSNSVERATGSIDVFDDTNNPLYYGDLFSSSARVGGRVRRQNGVWAVREALV